MMKKIIIIPDVHGRSFWRDLVAQYKNQEEIQIVFLGDYLDPYPFERITPEQSIIEFKDIIEEAKNSNNITLLLGNHDLHYFPKFLEEYGCRRIDSKREELSKLYDLDLFKVAYETEILGKKYLFTHAGVLPKWFNFITGKRLSGGSPYFEFMKLGFEEIERLKSLELTADSLNQLATFDAGLDVLAMTSRERGGPWFFGSCMWADIHEHLYNDAYEDIYQIFSHTLNYPLLDEAYFGTNYSMVDCRHGLELDCTTGKITEILPNDTEKELF